MENLIFLGLSIFVYVIRGENSSGCDPGARQAHPDNCSMYYICDADSNLRVFECPRSLLFNPVTTDCDVAERVTCFVTAGEEEGTTRDGVSDEGYGETEKESSEEEKTSETESGHHKGFYFITDSSGESSETVESKGSVSANEDEHSQRFHSNQSPAEEEKYMHAQSTISKHNGEATDTEKSKDVSETLDPSDRTLEESYEVKEGDKSNPELSTGSHELLEPEISEEDFAPKELETDQKQISSSSTDTEDADDDAGGDYRDETDRLKKREATEKDLVTEDGESEMGEKDEDSDHKVEDERVESVLPDEELKVPEASTSTSEPNHIPETSTNISAPVHPQEDLTNINEHILIHEASTNNDSTPIQETATHSATTHMQQVSINNENSQIKTINGTNFLIVESMAEPIANWTENIEDGWTDLQIFWKHPADEDFQGYVNFKYPSNSMSSTGEIKDLVKGVLHLGEETESAVDEKDEESSKQKTQTE